MNMQTKQCPACEQAKPVTAFYRLAGFIDTYRPYCKECTRAKRRAAYQRYGGKDVPYEQVLKRRYGITLADYNAMSLRQAHRCAVCRRPETAKSRGGGTRRLSVDHDHATGRVRGLLCHRCNLVVWALEDNHVTLPAIAAYIEAFRASFLVQPDS